MKLYVQRRGPSLWFLLAFLCISSAALAQKTVTGTVVNDKDKTPVAGATVTVRGTKISTATGSGGAFSIAVPAGKTLLVVSSVGFDAHEVDITSQDSVSISLMQNSGALDQVVVTGYTSQKKKDLTGSVAIVNVAEMNRQPTNQIANQLQGQASGVTIVGSGQPGETPEIRIRGINTFGANSPLFVVDGVPTTNVADLNPNDLESIQVLKDAGAASIYGSRASNGVLIVTTKKGRSGRPTVSYDGYAGVQTVPSGNPWHTLSPIDMAQLKFNALSNSGTPNTSDALYGDGTTPSLPDYISPAGAKEGDPAVNPDLYFVNPNYTSPAELATFNQITRANKTGTNWFKEITKSAPITSHNINVSGGNENAKYLLSMNYFNQQGIVINTYLKRYAVRANTVFNVSKNIHIGENLSYTLSDNPTISPNNGGSAIGMSIRQQPIIPVYDIKGNFAGNSSAGNLGDAYNPVALQKRTSNNKYLDHRLFGNVYADIDFLKHFTFHTSFGGESYSGYGHSFSYPTYENVENSLTNSYSESSYAGYNWTWTNTVNYHTTFGENHTLSVLAGVESYDEESENLNGTVLDYFSFDPNFTTLSSGSGTQITTSGRDGYGLWSQFARFDYSFKDKYLLSGTIRRDASSRFKYNTNGIFPAITAAWRISQEKFLSDVHWLTDLKIRGGWGIMGNQTNLTSANAYTTYQQSKFNSYYDITGSNNTPSQGFSVGQIGNPGAKWESDGNTNVGFDATLFKGALDITADYYIKDIKDLLYAPTLPGTFGRGTAPLQNVARMRNTGIDFSVSGRKSITKDLQINGTVTFTSFNNKVTKVTQSTNYFLSGDGRDFSAQFSRNEVGHPTGSFYGYKIDGFFQSQAEISAADAAAQKASNDPAAIFETDEGVGRFRYKDVNGDGQITDADRTFIGNPNPKFNYGINLGLTYRAVDFNVFFYGVSGNKIWNQVLWWNDFYPSFSGAKSQTALYNSWTPTHTDAKAPIQETQGYFSTNAVPNSYYVENGSYFRAKNVSIGYTLPDRMVRGAGIRTLRIYVQAANLFTVTKYSGLDPEIKPADGVLQAGVDEGPYPNTRQFLFGVNLKF